MARLQQGRRYRFKSGWLDALNIQFGAGQLSSGTLAVAFDKPFKKTPTIIIKSKESIADDSIFQATSVTTEGFTAALETGSATATFNWLAVDNQYPNRRGGMHSGYIKCMNIINGIEAIATDGSGDGSKSITFKSPFKNVPIVLLTPQEANTTGKINFAVGGLPSRSGFTVQVSGSSVISDDLNVGFIAIDTGPMDDEGNSYGDNLKNSGDFKTNFKNHKAGFHNGYVKAYNIQSGFNTITTDSNGDGTAEAITFSKRMGRSGSLERTPIVFAEPQESDSTGNIFVSSQADTGFTLDVTDSSVTSGSLTVGWVAFCSDAILTD